VNLPSTLKRRGEERRARERKGGQRRGEEGRAKEEKGGEASRALLLASAPHGAYKPFGNC
jgi:hypothetical protein